MLLLTLMTVGAVILIHSVWAYGHLSQVDKILYVEGLVDSMER
jgi:hypothetical protein